MKELTNKKIEELESKGFSRWTKGNMDRLYINAAQLGLVCSYHKTGSISSAQFNGERISNSEGYRMKNAKTFIDIKTGAIYSDNDTLKEAAEALAALDEEEAESQEEATDEEATEDGMEQLTGSQVAIREAKEIRKATFEALDSIAKNEEFKEEAEKVRGAMMEIIGQETSAGKIIERKDKLTQESLRAAIIYIVKIREQIKNSPETDRTKRAAELLEDNYTQAVKNCLTWR